MNLSSLRYSKFRWIGFSPPRFEQAFVDSMRLVQLKVWDGATKTWWFPEMELDQVRGLVASFFPEVDFSLFDLAKKSSQPRKVLGASRPRAWALPYAVLGVNPNAPDSVVREAYKVLLRDLSDGSPEPKNEVEEAYRLICRERGM